MLRIKIHIMFIKLF